MDKLYQVLNNLITAFREKPWRTIFFTAIFGTITIILFYLYVRQPKSIPEGSQIIQSTGDGNNNSNSK